jgi:DNA (cytosine-5)-methyltransferase 1
MKILNLYSCIGGNRKLWGDEHEITAVELIPEIAEIYSDYYPNDKMIVADAHQYLLEHYKEYDFIWASPPCPTHSRTQIMSVISDSERSGCDKRTAQYPDMKLYQEIILLQHFAPKNQKWLIENVKPYYKPLIPGLERGRHLFWSNFFIPEYNGVDSKKIGSVHDCSTVYGYNLKNYKVENKRKILRNMVDPELALHVFNAAVGKVDQLRFKL